MPVSCRKPGGKGQESRWLLGWRSTREKHNIWVCLTEQPKICCSFHFPDLGLSLFTLFQSSIQKQVSVHIINLHIHYTICRGVDVGSKFKLTLIYVYMAYHLHKLTFPACPAWLPLDLLDRWTRATQLQCWLSCQAEWGAEYATDHWTKTAPGPRRRALHQSFTHRHMGTYRNTRAEGLYPMLEKSLNSLQGALLWN